MRWRGGLALPNAAKQQETPSAAGREGRQSARGRAAVETSPAPGVEPGVMKMAGIAWISGRRLVPVVFQQVCCFVLAQAVRAACWPCVTRVATRPLPLTSASSPALCPAGAQLHETAARVCGIYAQPGPGAHGPEAREHPAAEPGGGQGTQPARVQVSGKEQPAGPTPRGPLLGLRA